jgi:hypothetical protein
MEKKRTTAEIMEAVKKRAEEAKARNEAKAKNAEPEKTVIPPVQLLAVCSDLQRILPNEIIRSALFNARNRNQKREYLRSIEIAVIGGGRITYRGEELRQDDAAVWMHLIHLAKTTPIGELVTFTPYSFCKAIGWSICNASYQRLRESLRRMQATALEVRSQRIDGVWGGESMSMIPYFKWKEGDETLAKYEVKLAPQLVELFGDVHYTRIVWEQRLALPDGLATWLHTYFASHRKPHPVHIDTIMHGAGMNVIKKEMTRILKKALAQLAEIGFLASWEITGDFVHVVRA